jgi:hypothetical protein
MWFTLVVICIVYVFIEIHAFANVRHLGLQTSLETKNLCEESASVSTQGIFEIAYYASSTNGQCMHPNKKIIDLMNMCFLSAIS